MKNFGGDEDFEAEFGTRMNKKTGFGGVRESFDVMASKKKGRFKVARKKGKGKKKGRRRK